MFAKAAMCALTALAFAASQPVFMNQDGGVRFAPRMLNYQGYLTDTLGIPITNAGISMSFAIYDAASSGSQKWSETQPAVSVNKGIFSVLLGIVTPVPDSVFANSIDRWLELTVAGQTLTPRTRITSAGYAYTATYSDTALYALNSVVDNDWVRGTPDSVLYTANYLGIARGGSGNAIFGDYRYTHTNLGGYACTTGTNGQNHYGCAVTGGFNNNAINICAVVAGGRWNKAQGIASFIGGGFYNRVDGGRSAICGGDSNWVQGPVGGIFAGFHNSMTATYGGILAGGWNSVGSSVNDSGAVCVGGWANYVRAKFAFAGGGTYNWVTGAKSVVTGGNGNAASGECSFVGAGIADTAGGYCAAVPGGRASKATGQYAFAAGRRAKAVHDGTFVWADSTDSDFTSTAANQFLIRAGGGVGINTASPAEELDVNGTARMTGFSMPTGAGTGLVLTSNATGIGTWQAVANDNDWVRGTPDSVLYTANYLGIARGSANNMLGGTYRYTHINLGIACTTGVAGQTYGYITISGGQANAALRSNAAIGGGTYNRVVGQNSVIAGGHYNEVAADYSVIAGGSFNVIDSMYGFIGGGTGNYSGNWYATIAGGYADSALGNGSTIGGGVVNRSVGTNSTIGGGAYNYVAGNSAAICGGYLDTVMAHYGGVLSGRQNIAGNATNDTATIVVGGYRNRAYGRYAFIGGGQDNYAVLNYGVIGGGEGNYAGGGSHVVIGGGQVDTIYGVYSCILGGYGNKAGDASSDTGAVVVGGYINEALAKYSFIGSGQGNRILSIYSAIPSGLNDTLGGSASYSMAFGNGVYVNSPYRVVFFDSTQDGRLSINRDERDGNILYPIHVGTNTNNGNAAYVTSGGIWTDGSSKYKKEDFRVLNAADVLKKITDLSVTKWKFRNSEERHIGPVAEDFYQAFKCGTGNIDDDSTHIAALDMAGVALVAVQELSRQIDELKAENADLRKEILAVKEELKTR